MQLKTESNYLFSILLLLFFVCCFSINNLTRYNFLMFLGIYWTIFSALKERVLKVEIIVHMKVRMKLVVIAIVFLIQYGEFILFELMNWWFNLVILQRILWMVVEIHGCHQWLVHRCLHQWNQYKAQPWVHQFLLRQWSQCQLHLQWNQCQFHHQ